MLLSRGGRGEGVVLVLWRVRFFQDLLTATIFSRYVQGSLFSGVVTYRILRSFGHSIE